ncbi:MAG: undecaprenyl-diphosphate phosphatase [Candidatus Caldarchaeales archaeon]
MFDGLLLGFLSGLVQGITEWLPISSKTLLFFIYYAWGVSAVDSYILSIVLNGSTGIAPIIYFKKELSRMVKKFPEIFSGREDGDLKVVKFLLFSSIVTGLVGVPLSLIPLSILTNLSARSTLIMIGTLLLLTALLNLWRMNIDKEERRFYDVRMKDALIVGFSQAFSVLPGISRSGITILTLVLLGFKVEDSLILSFLMSIPVTLGGSLYMYLASPRVLGSLQPYELLIPIITALTISIPVISFLIKLSKRFKAHIFLFGLSILTILSGLFST